jgi:diadenylate cyclase
VGISEVTDSLTVIVSEETGNISIAYKGELRRNVPADVLKERLIVLQNKSVTPKKFKFWKGWNRNEA